MQGQVLPSRKVLDMTMSHKQELGTCDAESGRGDQDKVRAASTSYGEWQVL